MEENENSSKQIIINLDRNEAKYTFQAPTLNQIYAQTITTVEKGTPPQNNSKMLINSKDLKIMEDENEFETPCLNNKIIQVIPANNENLEVKQTKIPNKVQKSNNINNNINNIHNLKNIKNIKNIKNKNDSRENSIFITKERLNANQIHKIDNSNSSILINRSVTNKKTLMKKKNRKSTSMHMDNNKKPDLQSPQYFISNLLYNSGLKNLQLNKMKEMENQSNINSSKAKKNLKKGYRNSANNSPTNINKYMPNYQQSLKQIMETNYSTTNSSIKSTIHNLRLKNLDLRTKYNEVQEIYKGMKIQEKKLNQTLKIKKENNESRLELLTKVHEEWDSLNATSENNSKEIVQQNQKKKESDENLLKIINKNIQYDTIIKQIVEQKRWNEIVKSVLISIKENK